MNSENRFSISFNVYGDSKIGHSNVTFTDPNGTRVTIGANQDSLSPKLLFSNGRGSDGVIQYEPGPDQRAGASRTVFITEEQFRRSFDFANQQVGNRYDYGVLSHACYHFVQDIYESIGRTGGYGELFRGYDRRLSNSAVWTQIPGAPPNLTQQELNKFFYEFERQILHFMGRNNQVMSGHCFPANTLIDLADGTSKPISDIALGDIVLAFGSDDPPSPRRVTRLFRNITQEWLKLTWHEHDQSGTPIYRELVTTPGHEFLDRFGKFRPIADMIENGEATIILVDGSEAVARAERIIYSAETAHLFEQAHSVSAAVETMGNLALKPEPLEGWQTYNFEVEELHTYIAGGVRVHNRSVYRVNQPGDTLSEIAQRFGTKNRTAWAPFAGVARGGVIGVGSVTLH